MFDKATCSSDSIRSAPFVLFKGHFIIHEIPRCKVCLYIHNANIFLCVHNMFLLKLYLREHFQYMIFIKIKQCL